MSIQREEITEEVEILRQFSLDLLGSIRLLRWIGIGLLVLFAANFMAILLPFRFLEPMWELQAIAQFVDAMPLALIGFALLFHGKQYMRSLRSQQWLKVLSWSTLLLGILMFICIPLCINSASRLYNQSQQQAQQALAQRLEQIRTVQGQIQATTSPPQLAGLVQQFNAQYPNLRIDPSQSVDSLKQELNALAQRASNNLKEQSQASLNSQNRALLQSGFKGVSGLSIAGIWLVSLWRATDWARKPKPKTH